MATTKAYNNPVLNSAIAKSWKRLVPLMFILYFVANSSHRNLSAVYVSRSIRFGIVSICKPCFCYCSIIFKRCWFFIRSTSILDVSSSVIKRPCISSRNWFLYHHGGILFIPRTNHSRGSR